MFIGTKYKPEELQVMALEVLDDEAHGGGRAVVLYMRIHQLTGIHPADVREQVIAFARCVG